MLSRKSLNLVLIRNVHMLRSIRGFAMQQKQAQE